MINAGHLLTSIDDLLVLQVQVLCRGSFMEEIPCDTLLNILSRLPMKSLFRFRCTSRFLCDVADDPFLARIRLSQRVDAPEILLVDREHSNSLCFHRLEEDGRKKFLGSVWAKNIGKYSFQNSCNGLLCFARYPEGFLLCNPLRKEILQFPLPDQLRLQPKTPLSSGLGFDHSTGTYKLIHICDDDSTNSAKVCTIGTSSWRKIRLPPGLDISGRPVFCCGALHWTSPDHCNSVIVAFGLEKEEFYTIPHPQCEKFYIVDLGGNLSIVDVSSYSQIQIWTMKDYSSRNWIRKYCIDIKVPEGVEDHGNTDVIGIWENGEMLMQVHKAFCSYDPKMDKLRYVHLGENTPAYSFTGTSASLLRPMIT